MQLSILIATHRAGLLACSRLAQACSWAGPNVEVIIRDNSGDAEKGALLPQFRRDNCTIFATSASGTSIHFRTDSCRLMTGPTTIIGISLLWPAK